MAKMIQDGTNGSDKQMLIVLVSLIISITVVLLVWKYYDSRIAEMEARVGALKQSQNTDITE